MINYLKPVSTVECNKWYSYADEAPGCLHTALVENQWATEDELVDLDDDAKKTRLMDSLALKLSPKKHTIVDLSQRAVAGETNSLCGLAALYQAMDDTVMTKSQLRAATYDDIRTKITKEMMMSSSKTKSWSDSDLLRHFYDCKFFFLFTLSNVSRGVHG